MRLLVLGGTSFAGRAIVEEALSRGYEVTLFHRGKTNPDLFPQVESLRGDRTTGDLDALRGRTWDAAIDMCGYVPRIVRQSAELLAGSVAAYVFISSISVYADFSEIGITEDSPVGTLPDPAVEEVTGESLVSVAEAERVLAESEVEDALAQIEVWRSILALAYVQGDLQPFLALVAIAEGNQGLENSSSSNFRR